MRDYRRVDHYLNVLLGDVYAQPEDAGHTALTKEFIDTRISRITTAHNVLDLGCGEGFAQPMFEELGMDYTGICLGQDYVEATRKGRNVLKMDFSFLDFPDKSFDLLYSRHSLEHSPIPLLTLMEWHRVSRAFLAVCVPAPEHYTYRGINHYFVFNEEQLENVFDCAGWHVMWHDLHHMRTIVKNAAGEDTVGSGKVDEYWYVLEKK